MDGPLASIRGTPDPDRHSPIATQYSHHPAQNHSPDPPTHQSNIAHRTPEAHQQPMHITVLPVHLPTPLPLGGGLAQERPEALPARPGHFFCRLTLR